ncbi:hypothetical protein ACOMCU_16090 [Lysinibacillus sp. UGB7]|uniref:hypothetical protein n=1 Tax=Lysinibacillus sp. UGB7 TaxID=3411039 RepID=UPI003B819E19
MGVKQFYLNTKLKEAAEVGNLSKIFEIISQDEKLAENFLKEFVDSNHFHEVIKEAMVGWNKILDQNQLVNTETLKMLHDTRDGLLNYLNSNVKDLSKEEREHVLSLVMELAKMMWEINKENKGFLLKMAGAVGTGIALVGLATAAVLLQRGDVIEIADVEEETNQNN